MPPFMRSGNSQPRWLFPFIATVIFVLSVLPLARLAATGVASALRGDAGRLLADPALWDATLNTLTTSFLGMIAAVILGGSFAVLITLFDLRARGVLGFLFMLPMMIPPQVTALSWIGLTGPSSTLLKAIGMAPPLGSPQPLYSIGGIALLFGVQHAPLVYLSMRTGLLALPREGVEAARLSGASSVRVLLDIVLPLAMPGLVAGAAIAFVSGVGNFGIPAILGIPASIYTLPGGLMGTVRYMGRRRSLISRSFQHSSPCLRSLAFPWRRGCCVAAIFARSGSPDRRCSSGSGVFDFPWSCFSGD